MEKYLFGLQKFYNFAVRIYNINKEEDGYQKSSNRRCE